MSTISTISDVGETTSLVDTGVRKRSRQARKMAKQLEKDRKKKAEAAARQRKREAKALDRQNRGGSGAAPWIVTLLLAAAAGFGGYYLFERYQMVNEALAESRAEMAMANHRAAEAEETLMSVQADLARARGDFAEAEKKVEAKEAELEALSTRLETLVDDNQAELVRNDNGTLSLQLVDEVLFRLGEAELTAKGQKVLDQVGAAINELPDKQIWVQGHTDDVPISKGNENFASNWELSSARALNVLHYLQQNVQVDPSRLAAVAFGEYRPVSNKRKWKNRRIEIVLAPRDVRVVKD
jgi:chemotaxis protein MotB